MGALRLCLALLLACAAAGARGAEPGAVNLRLADGFPSGHILDRLVVQPFIRAIERDSNGRIRVQHFPAEQLGKSKDMLLLTQAGVADIAYIIPSYVSDKMPLTAVTELPGQFRTTCEGVAALQSLAAPGGLLDRDEFQPNRIKPLIIFLMPAYQMMLSTGRQFDSIKSVSGLKIRTPGGAMDLTVRGLDAVPIRLAPSDLYQSMSRGTLDGGLLPYQSAASYSLAGLIKAATVGEDFGTVAVMFGIGLDRWKWLPGEDRAILARAAAEASDGICGKLDTAEQAAVEKIRKGGARIVTLGEADHEALEAEFAPVKQEWARKLDARGKPGSEILAAFAKAVAEARSGQ